jgi:hypothetical protein
MPIAPDEMAMLLTLAQPIDRRRQEEFLQAVIQKLEEAHTRTGIEPGPGLTHRTAKEILGAFWDPPPDLRAGRSVPRF